MIKIETLGAARIVIHTRDTSIQLTPAAGRRFGILLYLATEPGCRAPRSTLQELFFPPTKQGQHSLRELLYQVRRCGVELDGDAHTVQMPAIAVQRDWTAVTWAGELTPSLLRSAEAGFLPGYRPSHSPQFAAWYAQFRARIVTELCRGLLREVERSLRSRDFATAELGARACLVLEPANSRAVFALAYAIEARESTVALTAGRAAH
jgi:hypothetical protein